MPAKSKAQQRLFGMIYAAKKHGKKLPPRLQRIAENISLEDAKDFAETKRSKLPERVEGGEKKAHLFRLLKAAMAVPQIQVKARPPVGQPPQVPYKLKQTHFLQGVQAKPPQGGGSGVRSLEGAMETLRRWRKPRPVKTAGVLRSIRQAGLLKRAVRDLLPPRLRAATLVVAGVSRARELEKRAEGNPGFFEAWPVTCCGRNGMPRVMSAYRCPIPDPGESISGAV